MQDGSGVNRPLNQPHLFIHLLLHLVADLSGWLYCRQARQRYFWATVKFTETSVTEEETDCVTDHAKLGQESWGSSHPLLLQSGEWILSLLLSTCKLTSQQALGGLTRPSSSAGGCLLTHSCKNLGSVGHWAWADHPWHFSPGDLLINLKDRFVEPPAGSAVHGPPTIYMKTNWHLRHRSSITSSPPITPHSFYSLVTSYNILLS